MTAIQWLGLGVQASIMMTVFALGLTANWEHATYLFRRPALLSRAVLSMSIVMPIVAACIAYFFNLPDQVAIALVALSMSPVPPIIQKKELATGGRFEYVVGLLVAMSVLAIVLVPLTVLILDQIFSRSGVLPPIKVAKTMLLTVFLPLGVGMLVRHLWPAAAKASGTIAMLGAAVLGVAVVILLYELAPVAMAFLGNGTFLMIVAMVLIGLVVGHVLGGPIDGDRTALAISTASRHPAVALAVATSGPATASDVKSELAIILLYLVVATLITIPYQKWRLRGSPAVSPPA